MWEQSHFGGVSRPWRDACENLAWYRLAQAMENVVRRIRKRLYSGSQLVYP